MVDVFPQSVQATGTVRIQWCTVLANPLQPALTELNATDAFDVTPYFRADAFNIAMSQDRQDDTRLSDSTKREGLGLAAFTIDALTYIYDPQAAPATQGNKAYDTFAEGVTGYLVLRYGSKALRSAAAFAVGQKIGGVFAVSFGVQHKSIPVGDNAVHVINQPLTLNRVTDRWTLAS